MVGRLSSSTVWKGTALAGFAALTISGGAFFVDLITDFEFEFIEHHYGAFGLALLVGILVTSIGTVGLARHLPRSNRFRLAGLVFAFPWTIALAGFLTDGLNVHGTAPFAILLILVASILSIVLLLVRPSTRSQTI